MSLFEARTYDFPFMVNFRFSARTIRHILYVRRRECVRPRSTTTDHLSPTALVHTAPPRYSRPVTANRPPSPPTPSSPPPPPSPYALWLKNYERRHLKMYVRSLTTRYPHFFLIQLQKTRLLINFFGFFPVTPHHPFSCHICPQILLRTRILAIDCALIRNDQLRF